MNSQSAGTAPSGDDGSYAPLWSFMSEVDSLVGQSIPTPDIVNGVKNRLSGLLAARPPLPPVARHSHGSSYARHLLYADPAGRYEVVVMVWGPGQQTPVHDHSGIWCVEGVVEGLVEVTRFDITETIGQDVVRMSQTDVIRAGLGECGALIPPVEYHRIANPHPTAALTMHVYGGCMRTCRVFEQRPDHSYDIHLRQLGFNSEGPALRAS